MDLKTPLYDRHTALGGKMVPFAGYILPVQYPTGVIAEHRAVRERAGLFDVSHMGEVLFSGVDALENLQKLLCNDMSGMADGRVRYSPMCNEHGGVVDDLIVYRLDEEHYYVVVNAANRHKDVAWMREHLFGRVRMEDLSDGIAQVALQGPAAQHIVSKLTDPAGLPKKYYSFVKKIPVAGLDCLVSRTGYTGERGYELYCANADAPALWDALLAAGEEDGLIPCGLGARDTLRLEAAMPLYGHEMDGDITPLETGLGAFVKPEKGDFIGRDALIARGEPTVARVGLEMTGRGIAREHCDVFRKEEKIGVTTSGTHCPYLGKAVAMALVDKDAAEPGSEVEVDVRGRRVAARVVPLPFYHKA
ncbi:MAG: glycine cleavage system aminomethyltransferase GcvT [Eubacteriales bacterium]|nr:glycine cleavage system aminomethyltransferase GcvT [Eubacteriales bacterium]